MDKKKNKKNKNKNKKKIKKQKTKKYIKRKTKNRKQTKNRNKQKRWSTKYHTENCILTTTNPLKSGDELNWSVVVNSSYSTSGTLVICTAI